MGAAGGVTVVIVGKRHPMESVIVLGHGMYDMPDGRLAGVGMGGDAFHRDSRKRLNRQAQCQEHDDEQFAPIGHGWEV